MQSIFRRPRAAQEPDLQRLPPMLQTEDHFTSLTHAVAAVLWMFEVETDLDRVSGIMGDCFAINLDLSERRLGAAGPEQLQVEGLADLGLRATMVLGEASLDMSLRLATHLESAIRDHRPCLVCGGWQPARVAERDWFWGVVHAHEVSRSFFLGTTMRDVLLDKMPAHGVRWPHGAVRPRAVCPIADYAPPGLRPGRLARRTLTRGVALLMGQDGQGLAQYDDVIGWLRAFAPEATMPERCCYPYPMPVAVRCQFEAMARYLRAVLDVAPARKRAAITKALTIACQAASLLLAHEPPRVFPRDSQGEIEMGRPPWAPTAWEEFLEALRDPQGEARGREIAKYEQLRQLHGDLIEALEFVVSD